MVVVAGVVREKILPYQVQNEGVGEDVVQNEGQNLHRDAGLHREILLHEDLHEIHLLHRNHHPQNLHHLHLQNLLLHPYYKLFFLLQLYKD